MSDLPNRSSPMIENDIARTDFEPSATAQASSSTTPQEIVAGSGGEEHHHHYVFKFLRKERPLPGMWLLRWMLMALFVVMFLAGWNDASQGPLLPSLQAYYNVNYLVISTIWLASFAGFLTAGLTNVLITDRFGFGIAAPFGALSQGLGYVFMFWGAPFPVFVLAYLAVGFGLGLQDAQVNSLVARLPNASPKMFILHAVYGLGATVSPLVSTAFVQHDNSRVYNYFAASLGLAIATFILMVIVFRGRTEDQVVGVREPDDVPSSEQSRIADPEKGREGGETLPGPITATGGELAIDAAPELQKRSGSGSKMNRIMRTPAVHFMAFYIMIYVGIEVTIGGWATTFIVTERGGNDDAGYVTTGYFGGLTLGRVILIPLTKKMGNHMSIYVYSIIAIALELVVWFVHSIPGNAVAFAIIGMVLGPCYPIVMMVVVDVIPGELQGGTIGWIASLGQGGSAMMPFITGAISDRYGVWILQPLIIAFLGASIVLWALVPRHRTVA